MTKRLMDRKTQEYTKTMELIGSFLYVFLTLNIFDDEDINDANEQVSWIDYID